MALPRPKQMLALLDEQGAEGRRKLEDAYEHGDWSVMCRALAVAEDARLRAILCQIAATVRDPQALHCLLERLDDPDPSVVAAAADAIGNTAYRQRVDHALTLRLGERLIGLFEDERSPCPVRTGAQYALGLLGYRAAVPPLVRGLFDPEPLVRANSAEALSHIGDDAAIPPLERRVAKELDERTRSYMLAALDQLREG